MRQVMYRQVPGFPLYRVGSDGTVWSCQERYRPLDGVGFRYRAGAVWRLLKQTPTPRGYVQVGLRHCGKLYTRKVHVLVMLAFVGPRPPGLVILHGDDNRKNNRLENLSYNTQKKNMEDMVARGRSMRGMKHPKAILTDHLVKQIVHLRSEGWPMWVVADKTGSTISMVQRVLSGRAWNHITGIARSRNELAQNRN